MPVSSHTVLTSPAPTWRHRAPARARAVAAGTSAMLVSLLLALGCGRGPSARTDSAAGTAGGQQPLPTPTAGATDTITVATSGGPVVLRGDSAPGTVAVAAQRLQWTPGIVITRLRSAGLAPSAPAEVRQPFFDPPGMRVTLAGGHAEVQTFIFGDASAVSRATAALDTTRVAPPTMQVAWRMPPSLVVNNNLAAIVLTRDRALRDSIRWALTTHHR